MSINATPFPGLREDYVPGKTIRMGRHLFFVPPMLLKDLRATVKEGLLNKVANPADANNLSPEEFDAGVGATVTVLHRALKRNYPAITLEEIENVLDVNNSATVMAAAITANEETEEHPQWLAAGTGAPTPAATA